MFKYNIMKHYQKPAYGCVVFQNGVAWLGLWKGHNKSRKEEESSKCMHIRSIADLPLKIKDMRSIADIPKLADVGYGSTD